jgi:hypothetical protein
MKQTVSNQMGDGQIVKEGNDIPTSYDNFILHDLEKSIVVENKTLDDHYDYVMSSLGNSYKDANKYAYGNILQAIKTIVTCKKTHPRRTEKCKEAIGYLHQDMSMASNTIQNILLLFGVKLSTSQILGYSEKVLTQRDPNWILKFGGFYYA